MRQGRPPPGPGPAPARLTTVTKGNNLLTRRPTVQALPQTRLLDDGARQPLPIDVLLHLQVIGHFSVIL